MKIKNHYEIDSNFDDDFDSSSDPDPGKKSTDIKSVDETIQVLKWNASISKARSKCI